MSETTITTRPVTRWTIKREGREWQGRRVVIGAKELALAGIDTRFVEVVTEAGEIRIRPIRQTHTV